MGNPETPRAVMPGTLRLTRPMTKGAPIEAVQRTLTVLGYEPGRPDGLFGPQTQAAVIAFQIDHDLTPDGEIGPETQAVLRGV